MRVLVIDGEAAGAASVAARLAPGRIGHDVAVGAHDGLAAASGGAFDALVLGAMPGATPDGPRVCSLLRRSGVGTPILMLAVGDAPEEVVRALEAGADDCVAADVTAEELAARLRALVRRHLSDRSSLLRLGDVELDTATGRAAVRGATLALTEREGQLLEHLLLRRDTPQPQEALLAGVWGRSDARSANVVDACVTRLRRKLLASRAGVTVAARKRRGYVLEVGGADAQQGPGRRDATP